MSDCWIFTYMRTRKKHQMARACFHTSSCCAQQDEVQKYVPFGVPFLLVRMLVNTIASHTPTELFLLVVQFKHILFLFFTETFYVWNHLYRCILFTHTNISVQTSSPSVRIFCLTRAVDNNSFKS